MVKYNLLSHFAVFVHIQNPEVQLLIVFVFLVRLGNRLDRSHDFSVENIFHYKKYNPKQVIWLLLQLLVILK